MCKIIALHLRSKIAQVLHQSSETSISQVTKTNSTGSVSSEMQAATASTARSQDPLAQKFAAEQVAQKREIAATTAQTASTPKPTSTAAASTATPAAKYVVRSNESLWGIASRIATEQNRPVSEVMQQIKNSNEHAFIQGDVNRLRRGAALNLHGMQQAKTACQSLCGRTCQSAFEAVRQNQIPFESS